MYKVAYHPIYVHPLPAGHRFPMEKYEMLYQQLLHEGTIETRDVFSPDTIDAHWVLNVHEATYLNKLQQLSLTQSEVRQTGFPISEQLVERELRILEGTRRCADYALTDQISFNIAGGTHHAFADRGEGFCLLNDQAVAARYLVDQKKATQILIIDLDVHQGNGTAAIFQQDDSVFTFSMHGAHNYPLRKEKSDLDIGLPDGIGADAYLEILEEQLTNVLKRFSPDFVFYQCGVDILGTDKLGRLGVSMDGCKQRDEIVFGKVRKLGVPVVCSMGGGYSQDINLVVEAHANTYRVAKHVFA